tara:strand:- start:491 stop:598 length:108 start_codon:yes stop_codon:yes gene_type:complete
LKAVDQQLEDQVENLKSENAYLQKLIQGTIDESDK